MYHEATCDYIIGTDMPLPPTVAKVTTPRLVFPFTHLNPTMSSLSYKMMKQYTIPRGVFYVSPDPYGRHISRSSLMEREFFFAMQMLGKGLGKPYYSKHVITQKKFGHLIVDGYVPESKTVIEFKGCYVHCHRGCIISKIGKFCSLTYIKFRRKNTNCYMPYMYNYIGKNCHMLFFPDYPSDNLRNYKGVTQARQNRIDAKRIEFLLGTFPDHIAKVEVVWECEWALVKRKSLSKWPALRQVINDFYEIDGGLILRECVRGGKVEAFLSHFSIHRDIFTECVADYFDLNSLYPSAVIKNLMPSGPPLHIRGNDVQPFM